LDSSRTTCLRLAKRVLRLRLHCEALSHGSFLIIPERPSHNKPDRLVCWFRCFPRNSQRLGHSAANRFRCYLTSESPRHKGLGREIILTATAELGARQIFAHTHLVRGGSLMLEPTRAACCWLRSEAFTYPPRPRWVADAGAYQGHEANRQVTVCAGVWRL
jgi:hypothetical protein